MLSQLFLNVRVELEEITNKYDEIAAMRLEDDLPAPLSQEIRQGLLDVWKRYLYYNDSNSTHYGYCSYTTAIVE